MGLDLNGKIAVVTGAAHGIGHAIARRLGEYHARVYLADIDASAAQTSASALSREGLQAIGIEVDVSQAASVETMMHTLEAQCGGIDIMVNNAGIAGRATPITEVSDAEWHRVLSINLDGPFYCSRAAIRMMLRRGWGRIVNVASIAGKEGNPNMAAYSASKAALIGLTKSLAKEVATHRICINAVSPAVVRTAILEQLTPEQVAYMTARIPMQRLGTPEEVAAVVHFLCTEDCSFVTGQCYDISGGRATY